MTKFFNYSNFFVKIKGRAKKRLWLQVTLSFCLHQSRFYFTEIKGGEKNVRVDTV